GGYRCLGGSPAGGRTRSRPTGPSSRRGRPTSGGRGASPTGGLPGPAGLSHGAGPGRGGCRVGGPRLVLSTLACVNSLVTDQLPAHADAPVGDTELRTYQVRTFGCQMNVHDSERMSGVLEEAGYIPFEGEADPSAGVLPDLVVFNTCAVRENADNRLYGTLGHLRPWKDVNPRLQIAVGGCLAQKDKDVVISRAPWVDVVFGTHNLGHLATLLDRSRHNQRAEVEIADSLQHFPSTLPATRDSAYAGWVSVSVGCNNTCTFCIVPSLRGKEVDRRPGEVLAEVQALADEGVLEVTLLGQNVNAYGRSFHDPDEPSDKSAFAKLLKAVGRIEGIERVRFTSPHPAEFTDD